MATAAKTDAGSSRVSKIAASPFFQADQKVRSASGVGKAAFVPAPGPTLSCSSSPSSSSSASPSSAGSSTARPEAGQSKVFQRSASACGKSSFVAAPGPSLGKSMHNGLNTTQKGSNPAPSIDRAATAVDASKKQVAEAPTPPATATPTASATNTSAATTVKLVKEQDKKPATATTTTPVTTTPTTAATEANKTAAKPAATVAVTTTTTTTPTIATPTTTTPTTTTPITEAKKPERLRKAPSMVDPMKDTPTSDNTNTSSSSSPSPSSTPSSSSDPSSSAPSFVPASSAPSSQGAEPPQSPKKPDKPASRSQKMPIPPKSPTANATPPDVAATSAAAPSSNVAVAATAAVPELAKLPSEQSAPAKPSAPARKSTRVAINVQSDVSKQQQPASESQQEPAAENTQAVEDDDDIDLESMELPLPPPPVPGGAVKSTGDRKVVNKGWLQQSATESKFMGRHLDMWKKRWVVLFSDAVAWYNLEEDHTTGKPAVGEEQLGALFEFISESDLVMSLTLSNDNNNNNSNNSNNNDGSNSGGGGGGGSPPSSPSASSPRFSSVRFKASSADNKLEWEAAFEEVREAHWQREGLQDLQEQREAQLAKMLQTPIEVKEVQMFKEGWLLKQGSSTTSTSLINLGRSQWKKRWVTLNSAGLTYSESDKSDKKELAFIPFDPNFTFAEGKELTFTFQCNSRSIPFKAESPSNKADWISAMTAGKSVFALLRPETQEKQDFGVVDLKPVPQPREEKLVDKNCIREGYLTKQGDTIKSLKSRYFVLTRGELRYYKHPKDLKPIGTIAIQAKAVAQASKQEAFTFFLVPVPNGRRFVLSAKDAQDQVNWLEALKTSVPEMTVVKGIASGLLAQSAGRDLLQVTQRSTRSIREGFILKQGHLNKNWKRRYFVLEPTVLEYYKNPLDRHSKGSIALGNVGDSVTAESDVRFTIMAGSVKKVTLVLCCEAPMDLLAWLAALQQVKSMSVLGKRQRVGKSQSAFSIDSALSAPTKIGLGRRAKDI